jgi:hypothetical protein
MATATVDTPTPAPTRGHSADKGASFKQKIKALALFCELHGLTFPESSRDAHTLIQTLMALKDQPSQSATDSDIPF